MCEKSCIGTCEGISYEKIEAIANTLKTKVTTLPTIGVLCGAGLAGIQSVLVNPQMIPYEQIFDFPLPVPTPGHGENKLMFGYIGPAPVVCFLSRFRLTDGFPLWKVVLPIRLMKLLGVSIVILSAPSRSINASFTTGDVMFLRDHINLVGFGGLNPLHGSQDSRFGAKFVAVRDGYDQQLLKLAKDTARELKMKVQEGVLACVAGPGFETVAEAKALKALGADVVGGSIVHEVVAARQCGMKCFALTLVSNKCLLDYGKYYILTQEEALALMKSKQSDLVRFMERYIGYLSGNVDNE